MKSYSRNLLAAVLLFSILMVALTINPGCAARGRPYVVHPEAVSALDSRWYDALLFSKGFLADAARQPPITPSVVAVVDNMRRAHPVTVASWQVARDAVRAGKSAPGQEAGITIAGTAVEVIEGLVEMGRLISAGQRAIDEQAGKPIDPALVKL